MKDEQILKEVLKGNKRAFRLIVERYMRLAYSIAYSIAGSQEDALDISQEAFLKVYKNLKKFDFNKSFLPWFTMIVKNLAIDKIRKRKVELIPLELLEDNAGVDNHLKIALEKALAKLNKDEREIIFLRHYDGYSYREIAELLGIPVGTVMSRLFYARKKLKKLLENEL